MTNDEREALEDARREYQYAQREHNRKSAPPFSKDGKIARYYKTADEPDEYTYDVVYFDRVTGREVCRYDGADPANTNPYYGATADADYFASKGLDLSEMIDPSQQTVSDAQLRSRLSQR